MSNTKSAGDDPEAQQPLIDMENPSFGGLQQMLGQLSKLHGEEWLNKLLARCLCVAVWGGTVADEVSGCSSGSSGSSGSGGSSSCSSGSGGSGGGTVADEVSGCSSSGGGGNGSRSGTVVDEVSGSCVSCVSCGSVGDGFGGSNNSRDGSNNGF